MMPLCRGWIESRASFDVVRRKLLPLMKEILAVQYVDFNFTKLKQSDKIGVRDMRKLRG
jgi:hypothetical protein